MTNMEKAEKERVFNVVWGTYNYKVIESADGLAIGVQCPNGDAVYFDTDLDVEYFYSEHFPQIIKEGNILKGLKIEAEKIVD